MSTFAHRLRRPWLLAGLIVGILISQSSAIAFSVKSTRPGGHLTMNFDMTPTTPMNLIAGSLTWNQVVENAAATWNQVGIGPNLDHAFFNKRSPSVTGDACSADGINEVRWASTDCGLAFGSAIAITTTWSIAGVVTEVDMYFDVNRSWNAYSGPLRQASGGGTLFDLARVALHEMGHAAGLDHPDDHGQSVSAIMNANISNTDALQTDDINGAHAIAWFTGGQPSQATLTIARAGSSAGTVTSSPTGINCGGSCSATFALNTIVTLTAIPASGNTFSGWSGDCSGNGQAVISMSASRSCTATFTFTPPNLATLTIARAGTGSGSVVSSPAGITCGTTCSAIFAVNTIVALTPTPNTGSTFTGWSGDCSGGFGLGGVTSVNMSVSRSCVATFALAAQGVQLSTTGSRGTVVSTGAIFGGFTLVSPATVMIAVRGTSLQTLGITQNPLTSPALRLYDSANRDLLTNGAGGVEVSACPATNTTAIYYATVRGQALAASDSCISARTLPAGVYTFSITRPAGSTAASGDVLFEVTFQSAQLSTLGSRGTVVSTGALFGGFTLVSPATVMIAVRGTSLQTLGITQNPLNNPGLRLYDAANRDLLANNAGGVEVSACAATNTTAIYYATVRGQPLAASDSCISARTLPAGVYTFSITRFSGSTAASGDALFEVTLSP